MSASMTEATLVEAGPAIHAAPPTCRRCCVRSTASRPVCRTRG